MEQVNNTTGNDREIREVEEAVICSLLLNENAIFEVSPVLTKEMFCTPELAFIYEAVCSLNGEGTKVDMILVETEMRKLDEERFGRMNGLSFVAGALLRVRHIVNLRHYAEEVKRRYMLRLLATLFGALQGKATQFDAAYTDLIGEAERSLLELREKHTVGKPVERIGMIAGEVLEMHRERLKTGVNTMRVLTGMEEFDRITGGLHNGELSVLGGRPSDGKTAVAMHIAMNAALAGKQVCFFSLEMTGMQTMNRIFAGYAGVNPDHLRITGITLDDIRRMENLAEEYRNLPLYFDHTPGNTLENIRAQVMLQLKKKQCDLVVIDYLNVLDAKRQPNENQEQVINRVVTGLKQLANETDRPVLVVSQLNRNCEGRADKAHTPSLHDFRDSGSVEQVADCAFFVYRPERHGITRDEETGESLHQVGELFILKTRNGPTGIARYRYNDSYTLITNYRKR